MLTKFSLHDSGAETATGTGTPVAIPFSGLDYAVFQLNLTAAATQAGDTLDVYVQSTVDGTNWVDIVHFNQIVGNGGAKRYFAKHAYSNTEAMFENASTLAAGSVRQIFGSQYRCRWAITDTSTQDASFTFSLIMLGIGPSE